MTATEKAMQAFHDFRQTSTVRKDEVRYRELLQRRYELEQAMKKQIEHTSVATPLSQIAVEIRQDMNRLEKQILALEQKWPYYYQTWKREFEPSK